MSQRSFSGLDSAERHGLAAVLQGVARGEEAALALLYQRSCAKLFGVCLHILHDHGEAEDVLQEVYLTIWRRAAAFDPDKGVSPITWLAVLARNKAIDRLRASKAHLSRGLSEAAEAADAQPLAEEAIMRVQTGRRLLDCLDTLEPSHAGYIRAAYFDGMTYSALAQAAEAPLGTMKSWMRRALLQLRSCLDHE